MDKTFTPQERLDLKEQENELLKEALRKTVQERETITDMLKHTDNCLMEKLALIKAQREEIESLRMYINSG